MTGYYEQHEKFYVAVDCIIFGLDSAGVSVLLTHRRFEPEKGKVSLMGGFVGLDESIDTAAARVLSDLTGLTDIYMEQVGAFGAVRRDPGERVISIAYYSLVNIGDVDKELLAEHQACWKPIGQLPELCFDHKEMIDKALFLLKRKFINEPLAFRLLPELFTLTQLQNLYQSVLDAEIDKRNFRKRLSEMSFIVATDLIDKSCSKRGARLYHFDSDIFNANPHFKLF